MYGQKNIKFVTLALQNL